jgi:hypothetical protein
MEIIVPGLVRDWAANNRVVIYTLQRPGAPLIEAWAEAVQTSLTHWSPEQPYLAVHDFSNVPLTLVERQVKNLYSVRIWPVTRADLPPAIAMPVKLALVMSFSLSGRFARVASLAPNDAIATDNHKVFFKREPAIEWLLDDSS